MRELVLKNKHRTFGEVLRDYNLDSFQYEYEKNNERSISFTAYKVDGTEDIFDMLVNENIIVYEGQEFIIKSTSLKYDAHIVTNDVVAKHIYMEFQNHYIDKDIENEELNTDTSEENASQYTLKQYLDFGFKGNKLGFEYEIVGNTSRRSPVSELGGKNGMEYIVEGAEYFNYIYFADNKKIYFYQPDDFYRSSNIPIIYRGNADELEVNIVTTDLKTIVRGYGKRKTKTETKNYSPIKPKDLKLSGRFVKEGTWYSTEVGSSYSKTFNCKWGNETLTWTNKQMSKGGIVDVYLDGNKIGTFSQFRKTSKTDPIVIAKNLDKGEHTFKVVFKGAKSGVDYKKSDPRMYIGTEKATILNLVAKLKGEDVYYTSYVYKSPNYDVFGEMWAPTVFDETATNQKQLKEILKGQIKDEPTVELSTNYLGSSDDKFYIQNEDIKENNIVRFIHKPLHFNTDLKVVKLTKFHSLTNKPVEVEFSNAKQDIIDIQNQINQRIKRANSIIAQGNWNVENNESYDFYGDVIGSVLVND